MQRPAMHLSEDVCAARDHAGRWQQPSARLADGLLRLGLAVDVDRQSQMLQYLALLSQWNQAYNLTAVTEPMAMVERHLLDSLAIAPWVPNGLVVDAGTGAGLPGLALMMAGCGDRWVLIDGNGKKVRFVRHVCRQLGLDRVSAVQQRLEHWASERRPDAVVARALAPLGQLVEWTSRWLDQGTVLLAMKADLQDSELAEVRPPYNVSVQALPSQAAGPKRTLAVIGRAGAVETVDNTA